MPDEVTSQGLRYSVVVPVYNEAENIGKLCRAVKEQLPPGHQLLSVYDFNEDTTLPERQARSVRL